MSLCGEYHGPADEKDLQLVPRRQAKRDALAACSKLARQSGATSTPRRPGNSCRVCSLKTAAARIKSETV
jgi:hypothetical protein